MEAEAFEKLFRREIKFIAGAAKINQLPKLILPEIAFIGKSNVGKSSLINATCSRLSLAKVSNTPGRTRQINFFSVADKFILVDLPGYGFAKVPDYVKQEWEQLITYYIANSPNLKLVNLLIDARRGIKENDITIIELLRLYNREFQIVFTKIDQVSLSNDTIGICENSLASLDCQCNVIYTSSRRKKGVRTLKSSFKKYI